eukprot:4436833-Pleurochrysis_carterae.AAC.1
MALEQVHQAEELSAVALADRRWLKLRIANARQRSKPVRARAFSASQYLGDMQQLRRKNGARGEGDREIERHRHASQQLAVLPCVFTSSGDKLLQARSVAAAHHATLKVTQLVWAKKQRPRQQKARPLSKRH